MISKKWAQLFISLILAVLFVQLYLRGIVDRKSGEFDIVQVVAAAHDVPSQIILKASDLKLIPVASKFVQPTAVVSKIPGDPLKPFVGKMTLIPVPAESQLTLAMLATPSVQDIPQIIQPGKRAYPLLLARSETLQLLKPGTRIDIIANLTVRQGSTGGNESAAQTVLQNIRILSVRSEILHEPKLVSARETNEGLLLSLELTPIEVEKLAVAEKVSQGDFRISIRSTSDEGVGNLPTVTARDLLSSVNTNK